MIISNAINMRFVQPTCDRKMSKDQKKCQGYWAWHFRHWQVLSWHDQVTISVISLFWAVSNLFKTKNGSYCQLESMFFKWLEIITKLSFGSAAALHEPLRYAEERCNIHVNYVVNDEYWIFPIGWYFFAHTYYWYRRFCFFVFPMFVLVVLEHVWSMLGQATETPAAPARAAMRNAVEENVHMSYDFPFLLLPRC